MERVFDDDLVKLYFQPIITLHDTYNWPALRKFFAANADYLTEMVLDIPISKTPPRFPRPSNQSTQPTRPTSMLTGLSSGIPISMSKSPKSTTRPVRISSKITAETIKDNFSYTGEFSSNLLRTGEEGNNLFVESYYGTVFDPWANYWCGTWKTKPPVQYHLWDKTIGWHGKYLQVVTQSEIGFVTAVNIAGMKDKVNLAINVSTKENGITGWVTKIKVDNSGTVQRDSKGAAILVQMPHLGYLIDARTLIWLAKGNPETYEGTWNMFLEWTDAVSSPAWYNIYHKTFEVTVGTGEIGTGTTQGCAKYHNHTPGNNKDSCQCEDHTCNSTK